MAYEDSVRFDLMLLHIEVLVYHISSDVCVCGGEERKSWGGGRKERMDTDSGWSCSAGATKPFNVCPTCGLSLAYVLFEPGIRFQCRCRLAPTLR